MFLCLYIQHCTLGLILIEICKKSSVLGLSEVQDEGGSVVIWEKFKRCYEKVWEKLKLWKVWNILKQILTQVPFWTREAFPKQNQIDDEYFYYVGSTFVVQNPGHSTFQLIQNFPISS